MRRPEWTLTLRRSGTWLAAGLVNTMLGALMVCCGTSSAAFIRGVRRARAGGRRVPSHMRSHPRWTGPQYLLVSLFIGFAELLMTIFFLVPSTRDQIIGLSSPPASVQALIRNNMQYVIIGLYCLVGVAVRCRRAARAVPARGQPLGSAGGIYGVGVLEAPHDRLRRGRG